MMVNYGMDQMKFGQAVLSGQSIRLVAKLHSLTNLRGVAKADAKAGVEDEVFNCFRGRSEGRFFNLDCKKWRI